VRLDAVGRQPADAGFGGRFYLVGYLRQGERVFETYWTNGRGVEPMGNGYTLLDLTIYGRQETWEDSPPGWPKPWGGAGGERGARGGEGWGREVLAGGRPPALKGSGWANCRRAADAPAPLPPRERRVAAARRIPMR